MRKRVESSPDEELAALARVSLAEAPPQSFLFLILERRCGVHTAQEISLGAEKTRSSAKKKGAATGPSGSFVSLAKNEAPQGVERPFFGEKETIEMPADTSEHRSFIFNRLRSSSIHFTQQMSVCQSVAVLSFPLRRKRDPTSESFVYLATCLSLYGTMIPAVLHDWYVHV